MKVPILALAIGAMAIYEDANALSAKKKKPTKPPTAKTCVIGGPHRCPGDQVCVGVYDINPAELGGTGICGPMCNPSVQGEGCAEGYECVVTDPMPGASGGCIATNKCYAAIFELERLENEVRKDMLLSYENELSDAYRAMVKAVVNHDGPLDICTPETPCSGDNWCFWAPNPHGIHAWGWCLPNSVAMDTSSGPKLCAGGTMNPCPIGDMCVTAMNQPPGAPGICVPSNAQTCTSGTKNPCSNGYVCATPPNSMPGATGYCVKDDPCKEVKHSAMNLYDQSFYNIAYQYEYNLDAMDKKEFKQMVNNS